MNAIIAQLCVYDQPIDNKMLLMRYVCIVVCTFFTYGKGTMRWCWDPRKFVLWLFFSLMKNDR